MNGLRVSEFHWHTRTCSLSLYLSFVNVEKSRKLLPLWMLMVNIHLGGLIDRFSSREPVCVCVCIFCSRQNKFPFKYPIYSIQFIKYILLFMPGWEWENPRNLFFELIGLPYYIENHLPFICGFSLHNVWHADEKRGGREIDGEHTIVGMFVSMVMTSWELFTKTPNFDGMQKQLTSFENRRTKKRNPKH